MKTYTTFPSRLDKKLVVFQAELPVKNKELLADICCNSITGYVKDASGKGVLVPKFTEQKIIEHLKKYEWTEVINL